MSAPKFISECGNYEVWKESGMHGSGAALVKDLLECQAHFVDNVMPRLMLLQHQSPEDQELIVEGIQRLSVEEGFYVQAHKKETTESAPAPRKITKKDIYGTPTPVKAPPNRLEKHIG